MDINSAVGTTVTFLNKNGYDSERARANAVFSTDKTYTVEHMEVGQSSSTVQFAEVAGRWNTVMFDNATDDYETYDWFGDSFITQAQIDDAVRAAKGMMEKLT